MSLFWKEVYRKKDIIIKQNRINSTLLHICFPECKKSIIIDLIDQKYDSNPLGSHEYYHCFDAKNITMWRTFGGDYILFDIFSRNKIYLIRSYRIDILRGAAR
jgi:hypothetical protein